MRFTKFRVQNYRNIKDSGWIDVTSITAFVGQNEAGKSNLFDALYRVNPFMTEDKYNIDEDWPADDWGNKGKEKFKNIPVCETQFELSPDEIQDLFDTAWIVPAPAAVPEGQPPPPAPKPKLPKQLILEANGYYHFPLSFFLNGTTTDALGLDKEKFKAWAKENTPKFVYVHEYEMSGSRIELDHLKNRLDTKRWDDLTNDEQTIKIVLDLANIDLADFIKKGTTQDGRTVRTYDKRQASAYLTQQFKNLWRQKDVSFEIEVDGNTLNILVEDAAVGMPIRLARRSTGFRWYVSFAWKFTHASDGQFENCILLLEEPGVHLHFDGQKDLLEVFKELSENNTVMYTTHLASMVDLANPERIRIVETVGKHAKVKKGVVSSSKAPMAVIEASLGLTGDVSGLLGNRQSLIVEGGDDALILHKLSGLLKADGKNGLADQIYLWPARSATHTPMYAGFAVGNGWDAGALLDTDEAGNEAKKKIDDLYTSKLAEGSKFFVIQIGKGAGIAKTDAAIEDLFPDQFYIDCVNAAYGIALSLSDLPKDGSDMICSRVEKALVAKHGYKELDKRRVMNEMLKKFDTWKKVSDLPKDTASKSEKLFTAINKAFGHEAEKGADKGKNKAA